MTLTMHSQFVTSLPRTRNYRCIVGRKHIIKSSSPGGESLGSCATNNLSLLYDPKEATGFSSHQWNVGTNPGLAFASV